MSPKSRSFKSQTNVESFVISDSDNDLEFNVHNIQLTTIQDSSSLSNSNQHLEMEQNSSAQISNIASDRSDCTMKLDESVNYSEVFDGEL